MCYRHPLSLLIISLAWAFSINCVYNHVPTDFFETRINYIPENQQKQYDVCVFITTYNRSDLLLNLLHDLEREKKKHSVLVKIVNDHSTTDYAAVEEFVASRDWIEYSVTRINQGKQGFWRTINSIYQELQFVNARYFCSLQDDYRLAPLFFDKCIDVWERIKDSQKACLNILIDDQRFGKVVWGSVCLRDAGHVYLSGWVDMAFFCQKSFFAVLNYLICPIAPKRWLRNKRLSSGVDHQQTFFLRVKRYNCYQVKKVLYGLRMFPHYSILMSGRFILKKRFFLMIVILLMNEQKQRTSAFLFEPRARQKDCHIGSLSAAAGWNFCSH